MRHAIGHPSHYFVTDDPEETPRCWWCDCRPTSNPDRPGGQPCQYNPEHPIHPETQEVHT